MIVILMILVLVFRRLFRDYTCSTGACASTDRNRDDASAYCTTSSGAM